MPENVPMETLVGTLTTMDEDDTLHTYVLGDGEDDALFIIENNQLKTSENSSFNFEDRASYVIKITTRDDDTIFTQDLTIEITDVNDTPTAISLSNDTINENIAIGTLIGTLTTMDEDDPLMKWNLYLHIGRYP